MNVPRKVDFPEFSLELASDSQRGWLEPGPTRESLAQEVWDGP